MILLGAIVVVLLYCILTKLEDIEIQLIRIESK